MRLSVPEALLAACCLLLPLTECGARTPDRDAGSFPGGGSIAVLSDKPAVSPDMTAPSPEWLAAHCPGSLLIPSSRLRDPALFNKKTCSLLILPYADSLPAESFPALLAYIQDGGSILAVSGKLFGGDEKRLDAAGVKYYADAASWGAVIKTGSIVVPGKPVKGNVFPYRVPCRSSLQAALLDPLFAGCAVILVKQPGNPFSPGRAPAGKWCVITGQGANPLDPAGEQALSRLDFLLRYLRYPVSIERVDTSYAVYAPDEAVRYSVLLSGDRPAAYTLQFSVFDGEGREVMRTYHRGVFPAKRQRRAVRGRWRAPRVPGFYRVRATLRDGAACLDLEENGFLVAERGVWGKGPVLGTDGQSFTLDGRRSALIGVNYYESTRGELNWLRPDILRMRGDLARMKECGMNYVRIHYIHSKWFRDYFRRAGLSRDPEYFSAADTAPLPSERSLRILDAVVELAREQGLVVCFDLFSLVPEEMGDPIGWLGMSERIRDREKISWQRAFARELARRYRGAGWVTWDLWNEPRLSGSDRLQLREWARGLVAEFRASGDSHLITIGDDDSSDMLDILDYACLHGRDVPPAGPGGAGKPVMFQELWNEAGWSVREEQRQAEKIRMDFAAFEASGLAGLAPWQWTGQSRLWDLGRDERWDDELGMCVRDDGSEKPAGAAYRDAIARFRLREAQGQEAVR